MASLAVDEDFDIHDYRHGLKLLQQGGDTLTFQNREGYDCPACGRPFSRLLLAQTDELSFRTAPSGPICIVRTPEEFLVLTH